MERITDNRGTLSTKRFISEYLASLYLCLCFNIAIKEINEIVHATFLIVLLRMLSD